MNTITISDDMGSRLYEAAAFLKRELGCIPVSEAYNTDTSLGNDQAIASFMEEREVHIQAIDAFMDERTETKREVYLCEAFIDVLESRMAALVKERAMQGQGVTTLGAENSSLREENDALYAAVQRVGNWHLTLRSRLAPLGITIDTDELGDPALTIDLPTLAGGIESIMGIA